MPNAEFEKEVYRRTAAEEARKSQEQQARDDRAHQRYVDRMNLERAERAEQLTREALEESRRAYRQNRILIIVTAVIGALTVLVEFLANFSAIASLISKWLG